MELSPVIFTAVTAPSVTVTVADGEDWLPSDVKTSLVANLGAAKTILAEPGSYPLPPFSIVIFVITPVFVIPSSGIENTAPEPPVGLISRVSRKILPPDITFKSPLTVIIGLAVVVVDFPISTFISDILNFARCSSTVWVNPVIPIGKFSGWNKTL